MNEQQVIEHASAVKAEGTELTIDKIRETEAVLDKLTGAIIFVICRKCNKEYAAWRYPYCRYCWKKFFKHTNYIPTKEEVEKYCI
jgi:hypothetical protein